jgi:cystathionine beta-lyase family protein involved in aluminum resistance
VKKLLTDKFNISEKVIDFCDELNNSLSDKFTIIDKTTKYNQLRVLSAFQNNKVSEGHRQSLPLS